MVLETKPPARMCIQPSNQAKGNPDQASNPKLWKTKYPTQSYAKQVPNPKVHKTKHAKQVPNPKIHRPNMQNKLPNPKVHNIKHHFPTLHKTKHPPLAGSAAIWGDCMSGREGVLHWRWYSLKWGFFSLKWSQFWGWEGGGVTPPSLRTEILLPTPEGAAAAGSCL